VTIANVQGVFPDTVYYVSSLKSLAVEGKVRDSV